MGLNPITPGLRAIHYNATLGSPGKVSVVVQPGETLHVSDDIADQLLAADSHFREGEAPAELVEALGSESEGDDAPKKARGARKAARS